MVAMVETVTVLLMSLMEAPKMVDNSAIKTVAQINFAAPPALNTDVVGTDAITAINQFQPKSPNIIRDIRHTVDPVAGLNYTLLSRRLDQRRKTIGFTPDFITTNVRKPSAIGEAGLLLNAGFFQWVEQQLAGALTAQNYLITMDLPLNV